MESRRIVLFGVHVDALNMDQTVSFIKESILRGKQNVHTCINANKVVLMGKDPELFKSVAEADIVSADGQAVVWASQLLGKPLPERVPGIDLMEHLMEATHDNDISAFFFGARQEVVEDVVKIYSQRFSDEAIAGYRNGYFKPDESARIATEINNSGCSLLFVAIPSPLKERFIHDNLHLMPDVKLLMGVGGSFDVVTGRVKRAPKIMQDNGFEWLYRLYQEPRKMWKRYLFGNIKYILLVITQLWRERPLYKS